MQNKLESERIVTRYVYPPIPLREFDWVAMREGNDEYGPFGWGKTEQEAIDDLLSLEMDGSEAPTCKASMT